MNFPKYKEINSILFYLFFILIIIAGSKLAEAIGKGVDAINKMVASGEIEELRDVIEPSSLSDETEDYLQDDGEIDYSKVPDLQLPAPLPSSKFAQNPELLKSLNRGGKRKFDQLIGWSDGGLNDKTSRMHQPVFGGGMTEDSQSSDVDMRYGMKSEDDYMDEDYRRFGDKGNRLDDDMRFNMNSGPGRPDIEVWKKDGDTDAFGRNRWDDESRKDNNDFLSSFDKRELPPGMSMTGHLGNHHNMQNMNPNMPSHGGPAGNKGLHGSMEGMPPHMMHPPPFGPNRPPPGPFPMNFRPPNGNFPAGFRPMGPPPPFGPNQGPFGNNFQGHGFRGPGNFERPFGANFRGPNQGNNFGPGFNNFAGKNGPRGSMDNMRNNNFGNRGRGRDGESTRGGRGQRDNTNY